MRNNKHLKIFAAALLVALAAPTSYAQSGQMPANQGAKAKNDVGKTDVIALYAEVDGRSESYGGKPAKPIPASPGERLRIHLVGTAIVKGAGVERPIPARFSVAAGRGEIDIVQTGSNWALVQVNGRGDGIAQLAYEVTGNEYEMKGGLREGRITLEIGEGVASSPGSSTGSVDRIRWDRSRELTDQLYRSILGVAPQGDVAQRDIEHIYEMGAIGVRDVAFALADDADSRYDRLPQDDAVEVLGDLYRGLLRRNGSDGQLWDQDSGFRTNVDTLRRHGYEKIVEVILDAPEFMTANNLRDFGNLAGYSNDEDWRDRPGRYAVRDN